jgi:long-chain acyl-CoA synthetase
VETATGTSRPALSGDRPAAARTIAALWRTALAADRTAPAYLVESAPGSWSEISWEQAGRRVDAIANGLLSLGVGKGDAVAIVARTSLEWVLVDFALGLIGAIGAPVYPNSSAKEIVYVVGHSDAAVAFVEDEEQHAVLERARAELPRLQHILTWAELPGLEATGTEFATGRPDALRLAEEAVGEEDIFTYIYTSGTTGPPKGCMIRHRNYYEMADTVRRMDDFLLGNDVLLLYLPLAHNFGRLLHLLGAHLGYTTALVTDPLRVGEVLPAIRPTILPSVPRVFEKVHTAVVSQFDEATGAKRTIVDWALRVGRRASERRQQGRSLPPLLAAQHRLADRLVYSKVKGRLGGRLRLGVSGGAPLAPEIAQFFHSLDILILEGYGLTECTTACAVNRPSRYRFGTVGPGMPGFELEIDDDGEVLIRSETIFAGYLKDEEATRAVLEAGGWLRSGDLGEIDADGFLRITDRKKDILVTAGGKNVAPQNVENELKRSKYVSQAVVVGDRRPYVAALVTLNLEEVARWARARGIDLDESELARDPRVRALVEDVVDQANRELSRFEQVKRFVVLPREFSPAEDEVTPTLKLRRRVIERNFAAEIDELYSEPGSSRQ